jgi:hypothetical protein
MMTGPTCHGEGEIDDEDDDTQGLADFDENGRFID